MLLKHLFIVGILKITRAKLRIIFFLLSPQAALKFLYFISYLVYRVISLKSLKQQIQNNLKIIYGHASLGQVESLLQKACLSFFETLALPCFKKKHLELMCEINGIHHLKESLAHKKGAIILTVHAGNFEIIPNYLSVLGFPILKIIKAIYPEDLPAKFLNQCRKTHGVRILNVEEEDMYRQSFRMLNANGLVYLLADTGALDSRNVPIRIFNKTVPAATGWKTMAERSGAAVLPTFIKRDKNFKNHIRIYPSLVIGKESGDEIFQEMGNLLEEYARENPDEWLLPLNSYEVNRMVNQ
jgi:KDO2-lipid IV(A) lauroyltransferase